MEKSYIKDYIINLLENTYNDDLERLRAIYYGLEYILNDLQYNQETNEDIYNYNKLTTCSITIKEILKDNGGLEDEF